METSQRDSALTIEYDLTDTGLVITDMLAKLKLLPEMHVVSIDTLHLFPETYKLIVRPSPRLRCVLSVCTKCMTWRNLFCT